MNDLQHHVLAYYLAGHGNELSITDRWYPRGELVMIIDDKIGVAVRKFGRKARAATKAAAEAFVERLINEGAWSTKQNDYGGTMHQFHNDLYRKSLKAWQESDPVIAKARAGGDGYWEPAFEALTN